MHELSIAMSLVEVAAEEAERRKGVKITALHVKLGPLSGVIKDALLSAYELAREGSPLEQSHLVIEDVPVQVYCGICDAERSVVSLQQFLCSECGSPAAEIVRGRELELFALEIEQ